MLNLANEINENYPPNLHYRSYYYDTETGFYCLQSRYYDPVTHRFINADSIIADVGDLIQGYNVFAYCFNNPVNMRDLSGNWPQWIEAATEWVDSNIVQPVKASTNTASGLFWLGVYSPSKRAWMKGGSYMIVGTKYINNAIFYTLFKKHYCPNCDRKLRLVKKDKIANSRSQEAKNYDFNLGDSFWEGDVKFVWKEFRCPVWFCQIFLPLFLPL